MIFFVVQAPRDDYFRFNTITFFYATSDVDIIEYDNDTDMYQSTLT